MPRRVQIETTTPGLRQHMAERALRHAFEETGACLDKEWLAQFPHGSQGDGIDVLAGPFGLTYAIKMRGYMCKPWPCAKLTITRKK